MTIRFPCVTRFTMQRFDTPNPIVDLRERGGNIHWRVKAADLTVEPPKMKHLHCGACDSSECHGMPAGVIPKEPSPEWLQKARAEGRAEALALLLEESAETFGDQYIGSHAIADTGDYGAHWNTESLRELLSVDDAAYSYIDHICGTYWSQHTAMTSRSNIIRLGMKDSWLRASLAGWRARSSAPLSRPTLIPTRPGSRRRTCCAPMPAYRNIKIPFIMSVESSEEEE